MFKTLLYLVKILIRYVKLRIMVIYLFKPPDFLFFIKTFQQQCCHNLEYLGTNFTYIQRMSS